MADPPTGAPEPLTKNAQRETRVDAPEHLEPTTAVRTRRRVRIENEQTHAAPESLKPTNTGTSSGRVTTKEIRQILEHLQHTIEEQTTLIQATRTELNEVKHNQSELQNQIEKLQEEIQGLRTQIDGLNAPTPTRSWAAVAAGTDKPQSRENRRQNEKDKNCVRISTQRSLAESPDTDNNGDTFGRYLPTPTANTHIRTALLNAPSTQDSQVNGIGTTKTRIRFKDPASVELARNNTEWLNELGNDTRLLIPRFGVVVHHTPTQGLDIERDKASVIKKITEENDLQGRGVGSESKISLG